MSVKVFIPQNVVDSWIMSDKVELAGEFMTFRGCGVILRLVPGYYFDHVSGGSDAGYDLLGKAKVKAALVALGGETYMNSVIVGEIAYDVHLGFIAQLQDPSLNKQALIAALDQAGY
jgi:hypothetical protein